MIFIKNILNKTNTHIYIKKLKYERIISMGLLDSMLGSAPIPYTVAFLFRLRSLIPIPSSLPLRVAAHMYGLAFIACPND
jgi:hypothetical protein